MGRRSCSLRPESARGRVMMAPPVDVASLRPRLGDVEAPPKPRSSPSPQVGRGGDCRLLGPSLSPSPGSGDAEIVVFWGRAQVRALGRARRRSLSSWGRAQVRALGRAEFAVFRDLARVRALGRAEFAVFQDLARVRALGRAEFAVFRDLARVRALGRAKRSFLWCLRPDLAACQPHSVEWHRSRSGVGDAVFLSGWSVERRSDGGRFGSRGRASG
jgi:hypothetical protein